MERDYLSEFRRFVDDTTGEGPYKPKEISREIVDKLLETDPDLLRGFLLLVAPEVTRKLIVERDRSKRAHEMQTARAGTFEEAAQLAESKGDMSGLVPWLETPLPAPDGTKKKLGEMNGGQVVYASRAYTTKAAQLQMTGVFLRKIGDKVGTRLVRDVYTEAQLLDMWTSLR